MIDQVTVAKIMDSADIVDVVSDFVSLKRTGANYKGLCPFHDDRTPSFIVSPAKNLCKCFACGEGGSPVGFIMKHEKLTYTDALRYLARKYGIPVQEKEMTAEQRQTRDDRESMYIVNEWARDWFRKQLMETPDGRAIGLAYFHGRGFRDDILQRFQVGYAPNSRDVNLCAEAKKAGYQDKYLINTINEREPQLSVGTGLGLTRDDGTLRDRFRGRVIWPIFNMSGRVAGFGGRVLDAATKGVNVKYMNSPESIIYSKRKELFGLYQAKESINKKDCCFLVEGYTDVMGMHQAGVENVVASSGTALTKEQVALIHRLTNNIVAIFDGDEAGIHASERGIDMFLQAGMNVKLLLLPDGDDPDSFARKHTVEEFQTYLQEHQVDFIQYKVMHLMQEAKNDVGKMSALVHNVAATIAVIPDEISRVLYIKHAADLLRLKEELIASAVIEQRRRNYDERQKEEMRRRATSSQPIRTEVPPQAAPADPSVSVPQEQPDTHPTTAPTSVAQSPQQPSAPMVLPQVRHHEENLVQIMVRYGEQTSAKIAAQDYREMYGEERYAMVSEVVRRRRAIVPVDPEDEGTLPLTALENIDLEMQLLGIQFSDELFKRILQEGVAHVWEPGFSAMAYFTSHPDAAIQLLATQLSMDRVQLSRYHGDELVAEHIDEQISQHLNGIQLEQVRAEIKKLGMQMPHLPKEEQAQCMARFQELQRRIRELSARGGVRY